MNTLDRECLYWEKVCNRLRKSRLKSLQRSFYIGDHYLYRCPLILRLSCLLRHMIVFGGSGDGKTVMALQLAIQLLKMQIANLIVFDHKGSRLLLNALVRATEETRDAETGEAAFQIKIFTAETGAYSHTMNLFLQWLWKKMTPLERAELLLDSFGIRPIEGSETAFFAMLCELVMTMYLEWNHLIQSFEQLYRVMDDRDIFKGMRGHANDFNYARNSIPFLKRMAAASAMSRSNAGPDGSIDIEQILRGERLTLLYFLVPMLRDQRLSKTIVRLACKLISRTVTELASPLPHPAVILADESQHLYSSPLFVEQLEQMRDFRLSFWLFNQSREQLVTPVGDFRATIDNCVGAQMMLSSRDEPTMDYLQRTSPEAIFHTLKWTQGRYPGDPTASSAFGVDSSLVHLDTGLQHIDVAEQLRPRLEKNVLLATSSDPQGGQIRLMRNDALWAFGGAWVPFRWHPNMTADDYHAFSKAPPPRLPGMELNTPPDLPEAADGARSKQDSTLLGQVKSKVDPSELKSALQTLAERIWQDKGATD